MGLLYSVLKMVMAIFVVIAMCLAAWVAVPSSIFIQPLSLRLVGNEFLFVRDTPHGPVWGVWRQEVRSELGNCPPREGRSFYENVGVDTIVFDVIADDANCIPEEGGTFFVHVSRSVLLDGWFPLRPSQSTWSCVVGGPDCVSVN